ncbi:MAG: PaaI family thioesterase [Clostridiales bacterium]|nr:PaaI family thioesterase [Clostridiales bacterium]
MDYLEKAKKIFSADRFATDAAGIVIEDVGINYAKCSMNIETRHLNASNAVMGGAIFTLADFTFAVASNMDNPMTVAMTCQITFLRPAFCKKLTAQAKCIKAGKAACSFIIDVTDENGSLIASVSETGCRINKSLP